MKRKILYLIKMVSKNLLYGFLLQGLFLTTLMASTTEAQVKPIDQTFLRMAKKDWTLKSVIRELEARTDYVFVFPDDLLEDDVAIQLASGRQSVNEILMQLAQGARIGFKQVNNSIYVGGQVPSQLTVNEVEGVEVWQQVSGVVLDEEGIPIPGATIVVEGTNQGTATDIDGRFAIDVSDGATLRISFIGYVTQIIEIANQTELRITLVEDRASLDEIVVIGYGTQRRADLTGAISSVDTDEMRKLSARSVEEMLQGRAAGVMVSRTQGSPGSASSIHIRGVGSIGNTNPLWIVDGIRMDPGNHLNPNDIESIEILKDASAAAIYGAQAAHGVILVTTKRGKKGDQVSINFSTSVGQRSAVDLPQMLNREQFIDVSTRARAAAGQAPEPEWLSMPYDTDWVGEVFAGSGIEQVHNIEISGGGENSNFYVAGGYEREDGIMINNSFERYSVRANSDFLIGKRLTIGQTLYASRSIENPTAEGGRDLESVFRGVPMHPVRTESNPFGGWGIGPLYFNAPNPVASQWQNIRNNTRNRLNGNVYADLEIIEGLNIRATFGANIMSGRDEQFQEAFNYGTLNNPINMLRMASLENNDYTTNVVATYQKKMGDHSFSVMAGYEAFTIESVDFSVSAQDFPVQNSRSFALATGAIDIPNRNTIGVRRLLSQFGRITYNYKDKYLFTANLRRDGSSRFGPINRFGVFPSLSGGYNLGNEEFMKQISAISSLKIRGSWGVLGSDNLQDFLFSRTYWNTRSTYVFDSPGVTGGTKERGFYLRRFPNEAVKWEEVNQVDIGIDVGLFDEKLTFTADYYVKNTKDMLMQVQLPLSVGISAERANPESPSINIGEVQNRGLELMLNYADNIGAFSYNINANVSFNQNEVLQLNQDDFIVSGGGGPAFAGFNIARTQVGQPIGSFFGWEVDGIFQSDQEVQNLNEMVVGGNFQETGTAAGDLRYRDINGDGRITTADMTYIGNPWPRMIYGLNLSANYKGFDITLFLQGVQGVEIFNANRAYYRGMYSNYNMTQHIFEAWTPEVPTEHPRLISTDPNGNFRKPSSYFVEDGSYLKIRNFQLGYNFNQDLINRINLTRLRVFVNAQNFLTLTPYEWLDPELAGGNLNRGIDGQGQYPQTMLISGGLQFGF
ncbi:SusC/RagA family TonB-linked outer membrane protein [Pleomorphovibrio marinus]|uniref:SusC/RagA family TonB-linked outer membrane protein n=1 Tax=Pleomorphovibrio marinus TaxID=2164132 RepID=UPI000E0A3E56|nr:TonB-dependent receptor [Pleomorphovibrio marinus]